MAIVRIPATSNPFRVMVNGVQYSYAAGAVLDVPEAVAAVIMQHNSALDRLDDSAPGIKEHIVDTLVQLDMLPAVSDFSGAILADESENIILRY